MSDPVVGATVCPSCGALVQPRERYCQDCGRPSGEQTAATEATASWGHPQEDPWVESRYGFDAGGSGEPADRRPPNDSRSGVLFIAAAMILVVGILIGSLLWFLGRAASSQETAGAGTPPLASSSGSLSPTVTPTASDTGSPSPTTSASSAPVPPVTGLQRNCPQTGQVTGAWTHSVSGNAGTSCEFAEVMRTAFVASGAAAGTTQITATSPVTNQAYPMTCSAEPTVVTCQGTGNSAIEVLIYP